MLIDKKYHDVITSRSMFTLAIMSRGSVSAETQ